MPKERKIKIQNGSETIEAQIFEGDLQHEMGVIVCHPHPLFGGTMANPVVRSIYKKFGQQGFPTIRFNFRGVEQSDGFHDEGDGEQEDAIIVCQFLP